ncbi:hypothetical protein HAP94_13975 [Acidithiobacillus ferrivorans]|nr:hypothetical protein [Acidithiobacillus ferrivorans]
MKVIYSLARTSQGLTGYWSNEYGWTDIRRATTYNDSEEAASLPFPTGIEMVAQLIADPREEQFKPFEQSGAKIMGVIEQAASRVNCTRFGAMVDLIKSCQQLCDVYAIDSIKFRVTFSSQYGDDGMSRLSRSVDASLCDDQGEIIDSPTEIYGGFLADLLDCAIDPDVTECAYAFKSGDSFLFVEESVFASA